MNTQELWNQAGSRVDNFLGVFPLDEMPTLSTLQPGQSFVLNTQTHNLPGQHWIAIYNGWEHILVFDPLGYCYPPYLVDRLHELRKPVQYNREMVQNPFTTTCGDHCIAWLMGINRR